jgi:hypothetical protein
MNVAIASLRYLPLVAGMLFALTLAMRPADTRAAPVDEVHGSLDAFAAPGVALAWGVLRGKSDATTEVVVRIDASAGSYRALAVAGVDPFTKASQPLLAATPINGSLLVRLPRSRFADLPRTEWRFYAAATPVWSDPPALLVYYQGIPDTTPEFDDEAKLTASLAERIERARRELKTK